MVVTYILTTQYVLGIHTIVLITKTSQNYIMYRDPIYTYKYTVKPVLRGHLWDR